MLDRALTDRELTAWLENIGEPEQVFDTSVFRTITPIFVGNHITRDPRIQDAIEDDRKFGIVVKDLLEVPVPVITIREQHINLDSISFETTNDILQQLQAVGAVYKRSGSWIKLKHPGERTPGDWFVKYDNPTWVGHHAKKAMPIGEWLREFYGVDFAYARPLSIKEYYKKNQRFDSRKLRK
jgi:hypothetical protein